MSLDKRRSKETFSASHFVDIKTGFKTEQGSRTWYLICMQVKYYKSAMSFIAQPADDTTGKWDLFFHQSLNAEKYAINTFSQLYSPRPGTARPW